MAWPTIARRKHNRDALRFPSDLISRAWALIEVLIPPGHGGGRPWTTDMRSVVEAIPTLRRAVASGACCRVTSRRARRCPAILCLACDGLWETVNQLLVMTARDIERREAQPTAGVINSQSVKTTESGGILAMTRARRSRGASATLGLLVFVLIHRADVQDRDGASHVRKAIAAAFHGWAISLPMAAMPGNVGGGDARGWPMNDER